MKVNHSRLELDCKSATFDIWATMDNAKELTVLIEILKIARDAMLEHEEHVQKFKTTAVAQK